MKNQEISPELKKQLESLQTVPERNLQASHAGRENYLTQIKSLKPRPVSARKSTQRARSIGRHAWATRIAAIAAVVVVTLSSLGGTIYAAQAAQPDDLLYGVKTFTEVIQVSLEGDPQEKLDLYVSFANRRLQEIQNQLAAGEVVSERALALLEKHTQKMLEQAAKLDDKGVDNALRQIETNLQNQNQMMAEMGKEHPQGNPPGLLKAQEKIHERLELVKNGIREPQGFKEQMKNEAPGQMKKNDGQGTPENNKGQMNGTDMPGTGNGSGGK